MGKIHNLFTVLMPVVWGVIIAYLLTPIVKYNWKKKVIFFRYYEHFSSNLQKRNVC